MTYALQESGPDPEHMYNTHVIVDSKGDITAVYRKVHLFDVDVPNNPILQESRTTTPGKQVCQFRNITGLAVRNITGLAEENECRALCLTGFQFAAHRL